MEFLRLGIWHRKYELHPCEPSHLHVRPLPSRLRVPALASLHRLSHHHLDLLLYRHVCEPRASDDNECWVVSNPGGMLHHDYGVCDYAEPDGQRICVDELCMERVDESNRLEQRWICLLRWHVEWCLCCRDSVSPPH